MPAGDLPGIVTGSFAQDGDVVASPVAIGTVVAERYRVDRVIGSGGMGVVVQATHVVLQQPVAIKFLRPEAMTRADAIERFVREARAAAKVQSDFVVRVQDVALLADGTPYIVMEYVEGRDLGMELAERGALRFREAVMYVVQTCEALIETHAAGIIHGDLKPENIYLARSTDGGRRVKLLDFGISRISLETESRHGSLAAGTPAYMAPEQFLNGTADVRTEIWSLGAVLYELLAGAPPFGTDDVDAIRRLASQAAVPSFQRADVPVELHAIVGRCMEKDPLRRFAEVRELSAALRPFLPADASSERTMRAATAVQATPSAARVAHQRTAPTVLDPARRARARTRVVYAIVGAVTATVLSTMLALSSFDRPGAAKAARSPATAPPSSATAVDAGGPLPAAVAASGTATPDRVDLDESDSGATHPPPAVGAHVRRAPRAPAAEPRRGTEPAAATTDRFGTRK